MPQQFLFSSIAIANYSLCITVACTYVARGGSDSFPFGWASFRYSYTDHIHISCIASYIN